MRRMLAVTLLTLVSVTAWSHPGGKDKYGCHHDRKTGVYHCH